MIEQKHIDDFTGALKNILEAELAAGNEIDETLCGWPCGGLCIALKKPFLTPIQRNLADVVFSNINDPHYWKADYTDKALNQMLICGFGGIPDFSDM